MTGRNLCPMVVSVIVWVAEGRSTGSLRQFSSSLTLFRLQDLYSFDSFPPLTGVRNTVCGKLGGFDITWVRRTGRSLGQRNVHPHRLLHPMEKEAEVYPFSGCWMERCLVKLSHSVCILFRTRATKLPTRDGIANSTARERKMSLHLSDVYVLPPFHIHCLASSWDREHSCVQKKHSNSSICYPVSHRWVYFRPSSQEHAIWVHTKSADTFRKSSLTHTWSLCRPLVMIHAAGPGSGPKEQDSTVLMVQ